MAEQTQEKVTEPTSNELDEEKALEQPLALLQSGNDTHRFVGLALLRSILDHKQSLREDPTIITNCWAAISPRFLDALLRATENESRSMLEARSMVELAVAIIHVFVVLLPPASRESKKMVGRTPALVSALLHSSSETATQILQVLFTLCSTTRGAHELLELDTEALSPLFELSVQQTLVLDVLQRAFLVGVKLEGVTHEVMSSKLHKSISALIRSCRNADTTSLFVFLDNVLINVPSWVLYPASWLPSVTGMIHTSTLKSRNEGANDARMSAVVLAATLLRLYSAQFSTLLFNPSLSVAPFLDGKPFIYLYIKLLLVDIRATIPSLLGMIISSSFTDTCKRLAASYDIIVGFIGYLLKNLDDGVHSDAITSSLLPPDLMLQLRTDIAEAMSSTIEYIRDRSDATIAGPTGSQASIEFSPQARQPASQPLSLPMGSNGDTSPELHLVAAQVRALGLWLREDDNEKLRTEAVNIIGVLLSLYSSTSTDDIRSPIVVALQGIITIPEGVDTFLDKNGWAILFKDLKSTLGPSKSDTEHMIRAIEIVRVLLAVVESGSETSNHFRTDWLEVVPMSLAGDMSEPTTPIELELRIGAWQLAVELLSRAPQAGRRKYVKEARRMIELASGLSEGIEDDESLEGLREVVDGVVELYPEFEE